jgi:hypothetical protein
MDQNVGLRKRQQIMKANRLMFAWVAGVSVVVGFSLVLTVFLLQKITFGEKVLAEKSKTLSVLESNLKEIPSLRDNVRVLDTNEALKSTRVDESDLAVQSVLDALPASANSAALGSSLQAKLLSGVDGVSLDAIRVEPVNGVETSTDTGLTNEAGENTINFTFTVSVANTKPDALREVLRQVERSIRALNITALTVEQQGQRLVMTATGHGYYQPAVSIDLKDKVVTP